jgi:nucleotide-binding universal stress UspA family protein
MSDDFRILVAIELSGMDRVLMEVERHARAHDALVTLVHVAQPDPEFVGYLKSSGSYAQLQTDVKREPKAGELKTEHIKTQAIGEELREKGLRVDNSITVQGPVLASILDQARKLDVDLLIMGSHQHSALYRLVHGDTAAEAVTQAPCPVLIVPS